jgi:2-(1,2-epoxy-1,2-dihydrophenyl)acetyl-CoA isomerase
MMTTNLTDKLTTSPAVVTERRGAVLLVTLNRPHVSNALNPDMLRALSAAWLEAKDENCRAVVLTGAGRHFCAGADLAAAMERPGEMDLRHTFHPQLLALAALEKPVIAAINGAAAGGGLGLALAADIRIMTDSARLVPAWVQIGLAPDLGASWYATRLLGEARAFDWFTTGDPMAAQRALELGLANEITVLDGLLDRALERAQALASQPGRAVTLTKQLLAQARSNGLADQLEAEVRTQAMAHAAPSRTKQVAARMAKYIRKTS